MIPVMISSDQNQAELIYGDRSHEDRPSGGVSSEWGRRGILGSGHCPYLDLVRPNRCKINTPGSCTPLLKSQLNKSLRHLIQLDTLRRVTWLF